MTAMARAPITELVDEVEALCKVYVGKDAECEQWVDTCRRLERLDKLVKRVRRAQRKGSA